MQFTHINFSMSYSSTWSSLTSNLWMIYQIMYGLFDVRFVELSVQFWSLLPQLGVIAGRCGR